MKQERDGQIGPAETLAQPGARAARGCCAPDGIRRRQAWPPVQQLRWSALVSVGLGARNPRRAASAS